MAHTHYDNLKVARGAPPEVIRAAYKALSQRYHPDKNPGSPDANRIMGIINRSYEALIDPVARAVAPWTSVAGRRRLPDRVQAAQYGQEFERDGRQLAG